MTFNFGNKKVLFRGPVLTQSGYGVHARQVARWLLGREDIDLFFQVLPWGDTPWLLNRDLHDGLIGKIMDRTPDISGKKFDVSFQLQLPNEWDSTLASYNVGITAGVETDICNPEWITACNAMSCIVVPSKHAEKSLTSSGKINVPIHIIPEAFSDAILTENRTSIDDLTFSTNFNFLLFGQITGDNPENDRKNTFYAVKWFCEEFKNDNDVGLVIKTNLGKNTNIDRETTKNLFIKLAEEVRGKFPFPKIHLLHGDMSDEEVSSLYKHNQIKALLSATRGEGYGLPILEAAAASLPVIATNWSGHLDFLSHGKFIDIDYKLDKVHPSRIDQKIFMNGAKWAHPIESDFKKKISKFRNADSIPREWAKDLSEKVKSIYSYEKIKAVYETCFGEMLKS